MNNDLASIFYKSASSNDVYTTVKCAVAMTCILTKNGISKVKVYIPSLYDDDFDGWETVYAGTQKDCERFQKWFCKKLHRNGSFNVLDFKEKSKMKKTSLNIV